MKNKPRSHGEQMSTIGQTIILYKIVNIISTEIKTLEALIEEDERIEKERINERTK